MTEAYGPATRLSWLRRLELWLRWGALALAALLQLVGRRPESPLVLVLVGLGLAAFAAWRTVRPADLEERDTALVELALVAIALLVTGGWGSPYVVVLPVPLFLLTTGSGVAAGAGFGALVMAVLGATDIADSEPFRTVEFSEALVVVTVAVATGALIRGVVRRAEEEHERTLGRIEQLGHVNAMLSTLHDLVRSMPAPLSVGEIVQVIRAQLDQLFEADAVVLLLADGPRQRWRPMYAEGVRIPGDLRLEDLPAPVREQGPSQRPHVVHDLGPGEGLWDQARSGAYLWLWSRGQPSGLLALEQSEPGAWRDRDDQRDVLERLGVPLALALDNAVWFQRLRTIGAEEERQRIGAELHDRFAQSLAYVAMELDRNVATHPDDPELARLRDDVRSTLAELRETLRELRLKVTEERDLQQVLTAHLESFGERFGVITEFEHLGDDVRPPLPVEQQLLRVVQDLLGYAQREMGATRIAVEYETAPGRIALRVRDDGRGLRESELGDAATTLLRIVRERADAIGATVELDARPGTGTTFAVSIRGLL